ncbi:MAG: relaxase MobL [Coriobacteriia bacterium]|nr:relaxase MobL [Coriobacteriia bacterium]MCL2871207.1 relaxase MobL [Coriobacteriia bacterium]
MAGSALVVNHQVMLSTAANHSAIGSSRLLYIANRQGAVTLKTEDDLRIAAENERMVKLGYIEFRPGSVKELNTGHALFDQHGIPSRLALQKELTQTDSAIITTVVSVRREDAHALNLSTKQDWERLLRSSWNKHIEQLDVIAPENVRWCAALHINQENNIHVHVFSWDKSGEFNRLLPKKQLVVARENFVTQALKPHQQVHNLARSQARDDLIAALKNTDAFSEQVQEKIAQALPKEGSLKYGNLSKRNSEAKHVVDRAVVDVVKVDPELQKLSEKYQAAVLEHARLKSLSGVKRDAYVLAAESDLHTRMANTLISRTKGEVLMPAKKMTFTPDGDSLVMLPKERKQIQALKEEITSCLKPSEQLAAGKGFGEISKLSRTPKPEAISTLKRLPSVKASFARAAGFRTSLGQAIAVNTHLLQRTFQQAVNSGARKDVGDEAGDIVQRTSIKTLSRALHLVLTRTPKSLPPLQTLTNNVVMKATKKGM